jgi:hypothetical protein
MSVAITAKIPLQDVYESDSDSEYESECEQIQKTIDYYKYTQHIRWIKNQIQLIETTNEVNAKKQMIITFYTYVINNINVLQKNHTFKANVVRNALELRDLYKKSQQHNDLVAICEFFLQVVRNA